MEKQQIEIYQSQDGTAQVEVRFEQDTLWLAQAQMAQLFDKDVRTINEHVKNIYSEQELESSEATIRKFRIVRQEGSRQVQRDIDHYNLDMVISVGYRVSSKKGTQFRERGELSRGMPTAYATAPLDSYFVVENNEPPPVWPDPEGKVRGESFSPLYKSASIQVRFGRGEKRSSAISVVGARGRHSRWVRQGA